MDKTKQATVQYDDFTGTIAAYESDPTKLHSLLPTVEVLAANEFIHGFDFCHHEPMGGVNRDPTVTLMIWQKDGESGKPSREIKINCALQDFFNCFKKLNIVGDRKS